MVKVETIIADKRGWFTAAEAVAFYGVSRKLEEIVLHHWDAKEKRKSGAVKFKTTLQFLLHNGVTSANEMVGYDEAVGRIRAIKMVAYPNVAFTSGGTKIPRGRYINAKSVGIEIDPYIELQHTDGEKKRQAQLIEAVAQRCFQYSKLAGKKLPITIHRDYSYTACPGDVPVNRIRLRHNQLWSLYKNPPKPAPLPVPKTTYKKIESRTWLCNVEPTKLWDLDFMAKIAAKQVATYSKGHPVEVVGVADHPTGGQYFMTRYAFGNADVTGKPAHNQGFSKGDMVQAPVVPVEPDEPEVVPNVIEPTDYDKKQDAEISVVKGSINSLIALLRDIAESILNKLGKG